MKIKLKWIAADSTNMIMHSSYAYTCVSFMSAYLRYILRPAQSTSRASYTINKVSGYMNHLCKFSVVTSSNPDTIIRRIPMNVMVSRPLFVMLSYIPSRKSVWYFLLWQRQLNIATDQFIPKTSDKFLYRYKYFYIQSKTEISIGVIG